MKGDEIDDYITIFKYLLTKAGWERTAHGRLKMFKQVLREGLHWTILQRDPIPQTLDDWRAAAGREI